MTLYRVLGGLLILTLVLASLSRRYRAIMQLLGDQSAESSPELTSE
jgi:hypothetical protein